MELSRLLSSQSNIGTNNSAVDAREGPTPISIHAIYKEALQDPVAGGVLLVRLISSTEGAYLFCCSVGDDGFGVLSCAIYCRRLLTIFPLRIR
jgi:hypothetical protein